MGRGTHTHRNFIGDSIIGEDCRFGAGSIVANRRSDRKNVNSFVKAEKIDTDLSFLGVITGNEVKIGINCSFMPGVKLGNKCQIGPHSIITRDIEDGKLCYTKFAETIIR